MFEQILLQCCAGSYLKKRDFTMPSHLAKMYIWRPRYSLQISVSLNPLHLHFIAPMCSRLFTSILMDSQYSKALFLQVTQLIKQQNL
jgi:hypothetical protein